MVQQAQLPVPIPPPGLPAPGLDPISQFLIEVLGQEILRRVLRQARKKMEEPRDEPLRQEAPRREEVMTPFDLGGLGECLEELCEEHLVDKLFEEDGCGCHQRRKNYRCHDDCD